MHICDSASTFKLISQNHTAFGMAVSPCRETLHPQFGQMCSRCLLDASVGSCERCSTQLRFNCSCACLHKYELLKGTIGTTHPRRARPSDSEWTWQDHAKAHKQAEAQAAQAPAWLAQNSIEERLLSLPASELADAELFSRLRMHPQLALTNLVTFWGRYPVGTQEGQPNYVFNPSRLGELLALKLDSFSYCTLNALRPSTLWERGASALWYGTTLRNTKTVLLRGRQVMGVLPFVEDARLFAIEGMPYMQYTTLQHVDNANGMSCRRASRLWLARVMHNGAGKHVLLSYWRQGPQGWERGDTPFEKNWIPWSVNGTLYMSYTLCPHVVLRCNSHTGDCQEVSRTQFAGCDASAGKRLRGTAFRGTSSVMELDGHLVGVGHRALERSPSGVKYCMWNNSTKQERFRPGEVCLSRTVGLHARCYDISRCWLPRLTRQAWASSTGTPSTSLEQPRRLSCSPSHPTSGYPASSMTSGTTCSLSAAWSGAASRSSSATAAPTAPR